MGPDYRKNMRAFVEAQIETEIDCLVIEDLFRTLKRETTEPFTASQCLERPEIDKEFYLGPASLQEIIKHVCNHYNVEISALFQSRPTVKNIPRDACMFLAREEACMQMKEIAEAFSVGRTAVSNTVSRVKAQIRSDPSQEQEIAKLQMSIQLQRPKLRAWTEAVADDKANPGNW